MNVPRYKMGDQHPSNAGLLFWRYSEGKERWVSKDRYSEKLKRATEYHKAWMKTPKGRICGRRCATRANNKHRESRKAYWKQPHVRMRVKKIRDSKPEVIAKREARLKWRQERAEYRNSPEYKEKQRQKNKLTYEKLKASGKLREYYRKRRREDIQYKLGNNIRAVIRYALKRQSAIKWAKTFQLVGCSVEALKIHLQSQFEPWMNWDNYGSEWHVDHKLPVVLFDLTIPAQQKIAFHFENLRPMRGKENQSKSDKLPDGTLARHQRGNIIQFKVA